MLALLGYSSIKEPTQPAYPGRHPYKLAPILPQASGSLGWKAIPPPHKGGSVPQYLASSLSQDLCPPFKAAPTLPHLKGGFGGISANRCWAW